MLKQSNYGKTAQKNSIIELTGGAGDESIEVMRMINGLSRMFAKEVRKVCEEYGVPVGYRSILFYLSLEDGTSQNELAQRSGLMPSTVSITIDKMVREGYVRRGKDDDDARVIHVYLTDKGASINKVIKDKINLLEAQFSSIITEKERNRLKSLLAKVIKGYKKLSDDPDAFPSSN